MMNGSIDERRLHDIYRMRDLSGRLLYVGVTNGGLRRFMEHAKDKTWWREVAQIDVEHVHCSRPVIESIEREAIRTERPLYNVVHNAERVEPPPPANDHVARVVAAAAHVVPTAVEVDRRLITKLYDAGIDPEAPLRQVIQHAREWGIFASASAMRGALEKMRKGAIPHECRDGADCPVPPRVREDVDGAYFDLDDQQREWFESVTKHLGLNAQGIAQRAVLISIATADLGITGSADVWSNQLRHIMHGGWGAPVDAFHEVGAQDCVTILHTYFDGDILEGRFPCAIIAALASA